MKGKLKSASRDIVTGGFLISFEAEHLPADLPELSGKDLDIDVKIHREKRSLNANSYFHLLCGKIAEKLQASNTHIKNRLIREFGQWELIDGKIPTITVKPEYEDLILDVDGLHVKPTGRDAAGRVEFGLMRGSHTYNTAEMAALIDGVISEAKDLGIETIPDEEFERMMDAYEKHHAGR